MQFFVIGINYQTAPLSLREQFFFQPDVIPKFLDILLGEILIASKTENNYLNLTPNIKSEAAILSTCNRTEIYINTNTALNLVMRWLYEIYSRDNKKSIKLQILNYETLTKYFYCLTGENAVRHVFRVASGLNSMVLGETQILGQLKKALQIASKSATIGTYLNQTFQRAFALAKDVRSKTDIGIHSVSMAAAAVNIAEKIFPLKEGLQKILFIGAGEMITLCATHFCTKTPANIVIANRSKEHAQYLAVKLRKQNAYINIQVISLEAINLDKFDIVITSTASTRPIILYQDIKKALQLRKHKPILIFDLAVPRDVELTITQFEDVFLYTIDDLASFVQQGSALRQAAAAQAEILVEKHLQAFNHWLAKRRVVPEICDLRNRAKSICLFEVKRAEKLLAKGVNSTEVMQSLALSLSNKFLHSPTVALTRAVSHDSYAVVWQKFISNWLGKYDSKLRLGGKSKD